MKCFVYLRVSGKSQIKGDGWLRQFIACRELAKSKNLQIVRIFREKGVSGTTELEDRPALSELFADLEENGIKTVLIEKVDRLARDLMIQETIIGDMLKNGYTLLSSCEPDLCSSDPSRILIRQIFGALAQYDRAMITLKLRGARQRMKLREGRCEGRRPFGDHPEKPEERPILDRMIQMKESGKNSEQIAQTFNSEGIPTRGTKKGKGPWKAATIAKILNRNR
jgi:DNA invertase Pin-like site-specific DNA recombinase